MSKYSKVLKRSFEKLMNSEDYHSVDCAIEEIMEYIKEIDNGLFGKELNDLYPISDMEQWLDKNRRNGHLGMGLGVNMPSDKNGKLGVLFQIFNYIYEDTSVEKYIDEYYADSYIRTGTDLLIGIAGIFNGLKGDPELTMKHNEQLRENEKNKVTDFNESISNEFERLLLNKLDMAYPDEKTKIIHGDNFENIINSSIINKSSLVDVMNSYSDNKLNKALLKLQAIIDKSKNEEAIDLFNDFNEELLKTTPKKSKLRAYWDRLQRILPSIKNMADITVAITGLF